MLTRRTLLSGFACLPLLAADEEKGFKPLFDGKTLNGWEGDPRLWKVENGMIVGSTEGVTLTNNQFLISKQTFGDFDLRVQAKLRNHNSGVQFRSEALPGYVVRGYQADMAEDNWWGGIYEEKGTRGVMVNGWKGKAETVVRRGDWNDLGVYCKGDLMRITLNGMQTAELHDSARSSGILAFQLHQGPPMRAEFRNVRIKTL